MTNNIGVTERSGTLSNKEKSSEAMGDYSLKDSVLDALADARNSMRVDAYRHEANGKFLCTLLICLDSSAYEKLCALAKKQERSPAKVLRRLCMDGFRECFSVSEEEDVERKDAA
jgi:hypothetical protein